MFETITHNNFWRIIDEDKMMKDLSNDEKINTFKHLDLETLGQILHQYRFIVDSHANHFTQSPSWYATRAILEFRIQNLECANLECANYSCKIQFHYKYN